MLPSSVAIMTLKCLSAGVVVGDTFWWAETRSCTTNKPQVQPRCDFGGAAVLVFEASPQPPPRYPAGSRCVSGWLGHRDEPSGTQGTSCVTGGLCRQREARFLVPRRASRLNPWHSLGITRALTAPPRVPIWMIGSGELLGIADRGSKARTRMQACILCLCRYDPAVFCEVSLCARLVCLSRAGFIVCAMLAVYLGGGTTIWRVEWRWNEPMER